MSITLRLTDPASERNYYRLKIRSAGEYRNEAGCVLPTRLRNAIITG